MRASFLFFTTNYRNFISIICSFFVNGLTETNTKFVKVYSFFGLFLDIFLFVYNTVFLNQSCYFINKMVVRLNKYVCFSTPLKCSFVNLAVSHIVGQKVWFVKYFLFREYLLGSSYQMTNLYFY